MFSTRFKRTVVITAHAARRMAERDIGEALLLRMLDDGGLRYQDETHLWAWLQVPERADNLLCAAVVLDDAVIVKTVMHHWELMQ
jgi:hypothetical protein